MKALLASLILIWLGSVSIAAHCTGPFLPKGELNFYHVNFAGVFISWPLTAKIPFSKSFGEIKNLAIKILGLYFGSWLSKQHHEATLSVYKAMGGLDLTLIECW